MDSVHYLAVLPDGRYICNCCMPLNLGINSLPALLPRLDRCSRFTIPHFSDSATVSLLVSNLSAQIG